MAFVRAALSAWSSGPTSTPAIYARRTRCSFTVSVPVLSSKRHVTSPVVSAEASKPTSMSRSSIRRTEKANASVTASGNPCENGKTRRRSAIRLGERHRNDVFVSQREVGRRSVFSSTTRASRRDSQYSDRHRDEGRRREKINKPGGVRQKEVGKDASLSRQRVEFSLRDSQYSNHH